MRPGRLLAIPRGIAQDREGNCTDLERSPTGVIGEDATDALAEVAMAGRLMGPTVGDDARLSAATDAAKSLPSEGDHILRQGGAGSA